MRFFIEGTVSGTCVYSINISFWFAPFLNLFNQFQGQKEPVPSNLPVYPQAYWVVGSQCAEVTGRQGAGAWVSSSNYSTKLFSCLDQVF